MDQVSLFQHHRESDAGKVSDIFYISICLIYPPGMDPLYQQAKAAIIKGDIKTLDEIKDLTAIMPNLLVIAVQTFDQHGSYELIGYLIKRGLKSDEALSYALSYGMIHLSTILHDAGMKLLSMNYVHSHVAMKKAKEWGVMPDRNAIIEICNGWHDEFVCFRLCVLRYEMDYLYKPTLKDMECVTDENVFHMLLGWIGDTVDLTGLMEIACEKAMFWSIFEIWAKGCHIPYNQIARLARLFVLDESVTSPRFEGLLLGSLATVFTRSNLKRSDAAIARDIKAISTICGTVFVSFAKERGLAKEWRLREKPLSLDALYRLGVTSCW